MALHEIKKNCKIVNELLMYLMRNSFHQIEMHIDYQTDESVITFIVDNVLMEVISQMAENLNKGRRYEFEGYYWELMGESDNTNQLSIIGMLVDGIHFEEKNGRTKMIIHRKHTFLKK